MPTKASKGGGHLVRSAFGWLVRAAKDTGTPIVKQGHEQNYKHSAHALDYAVFKHKMKIGHVAADLDCRSTIQPWRDQGDLSEVKINGI